MATRDQVYLSFGQLAELSQLFETELGTALLAHDALTMKAYLQPNPNALQRLEEALAKKTLGATLKALRSRLDVKDDLSEIFDLALAARNKLAHGFFLEHGLAIESDGGRDDIVKHLDELRRPLKVGYHTAGALSQTLLTALQLLKKTHAQ